MSRVESSQSRSPGICFKKVKLLYDSIVGIVWVNFIAAPNSKLQTKTPTTPNPYGKVDGCTKRGLKYKKIFPYRGMCTIKQERRFDGLARVKCPSVQRVTQHHHEYMSYYIM
jgi:hypothetical protein